MPALTRITLNLTPKSAAALEYLTLQTEQNRTDVINRAVQLYQFWEEQTAAGMEHYLRDGDEMAKVHVF